MRHVNKTDVVTLGSTFGVRLWFFYYAVDIIFLCNNFKFYRVQSLSNIMDASMEDLARCPGIGERKVLLCFHAFNGLFGVPISLARKKIRPILQILVLFSLDRLFELMRSITQILF